MVKLLIEIYEFLIVSRMKSSRTRLRVSSYRCSTPEMESNKPLSTYHSPWRHLPVDVRRYKHRKPPADLILHDGSLLIFILFLGVNTIYSLTMQTKFLPLSLRIKYVEPHIYFYHHFTGIKTEEYYRIFLHNSEINPQHLMVQSRISGNNECYEVICTTCSKKDFQFVAQNTGYNTCHYSHTEQLRSHCDAVSNTLMCCY
jgi:hypothetical protein